MQKKNTATNKRKENRIVRMVNREPDRRERMCLDNKLI